MVVVVLDFCNFVSVIGTVEAKERKKEEEKVYSLLSDNQLKLASARKDDGLSLI